MNNLLEPWVLLRLVAGCVALALFCRAALTAWRVLERWGDHRASEEQLALERSLELAATFARVAAVVQALALLFTVLTADRLSRAVRGAMCAYGVFSAHPDGFRSLIATSAVALVAGVVTQLYAFDARVRTLDLARPLAVATCLMAPLSAIDLWLAAGFFLELDLSVVASCCSLAVDVPSAGAASYLSGPRTPITVLALVGAGISIGSALLAARSPTKAGVLVAGAASLLSMPLAVAATALEVAPHAFESPTHTCPFCLLGTDVLAMGYPLYAALFCATTWVCGAAQSALVARTSEAKKALASFARRRLRLGAIAWGSAVVLGAAPVLRFMALTGGASLFR